MLDNFHPLSTLSRVVQSYIALLQVSPRYPERYVSYAQVVVRWFWETTCQKLSQLARIANSSQLSGIVTLARTVLHSMIGQKGMNILSPNHCHHTIGQKRYQWGCG